MEKKKNSGKYFCFIRQIKYVAYGYSICNMNNYKNQKLLKIV